MADQTMIRISKEARDLAENIAQKLVASNSTTLSIGSYGVSQGNVVERALLEYVEHHPELNVK